MEKKWSVLKTEPEYKKALKRTIELFNAEENTPDGEELDLLLLLVKDYEDKHSPLPGKFHRDPNVTRLRKL